MKKHSFILIMSLFFSLSTYAAISPLKTGPVSQYGELITGKNSMGKGQIYGSCLGTINNNEVQVKGMSLFWSIAADVGAPFWNASTINRLVSEMNIQVIRAPMGVDEDWQSGNYFTNTPYYQGLMDAVVETAIKNDIYVIIDYHSHKAENNVNNAKLFFQTMAQKWGQYDHVIFEIYNEPLDISWNTIKNYADQVIPEIRKYSDNLIIVGTPNWDQKPQEAINNPINQENIAYAFHYYAGSHYINTEGKNAINAMNAGLSVFVTEWGTVNADGDGNVSNSNDDWQSWMNEHKLSWANWSVSNKTEGASIFNSNVNPLETWSYTSSGNYVKNLLNNNPETYTVCGNTNYSSSSSIQSSSSSTSIIDTPLIDDFADNNMTNYWDGAWYTYTDGDNYGSSIISMEIANGYLTADYTIGSNLEYNYVGIGATLNTTEAIQDLSSCTEISYKYKGAPHRFKAEQESVLDYDYHGLLVSPADDWTTITIPFNSTNLTQEGWGDSVALDKSLMKRFSWQSTQSANTTTSLLIDDVRCSSISKHTITFKNDEDTLQQSLINYGETPVFNGTTPMKNSTPMYSYTFVGWSPSIATVSQEATYIALFDSTLNTYTITFKNNEDTLQQSLINYGETPVFNGTTPVKNSTANCSYEFEGWSPEIETVSSNAFYQALFKCLLIELSSSSIESSSSSNELSSSSESTTFSLTQKTASVKFKVDGFSLIIENASIGSSYALFDIQGRLLAHGQIHQQPQMISFSQTGSYILRLGKSTSKICIK